MKKKLLVTLADENYVEQAKQLFSSVYWNAGWKGDYMLLAYKIPEKKLKWFRRKGILIKKCKPIFRDMSAKSVKLSKLYIFTQEFKKWKNIIYLDADIIVRASLTELTKIKGFAAVLDDLINDKLIDQFIIPSQMGKKTFNKLKKKYNLSSKAFNSGMMAFSTDIINKNTFLELKSLFEKYRKLCKPRVVDQPIFNLFFYNKWLELPLVYNLDVRDFKFINPIKINAVALHFIGKKNSWFSSNYFYKEWMSNLNKADKINLKKIQIPKKLKKSEIKNHSHYLKIISIFCFLNWIRFIKRYFGLIGIFLYYHFPSLYFKLKKLNKDIDTNLTTNSIYDFAKKIEPKKIKPKIYFYHDKNLLSIKKLPKNINNFNKWFNNLTEKWGPYCWILQTYLRLKEAGFPCELTDKIPDDGIIVAFRKSFPINPKTNKLLVVCVQADKEGYLPADIYIVQNSSSPAIKKRKGYFIPLWPQIGLIPRDNRRGDKFENILFCGWKISLAPELKSPDFQKKLSELDIYFDKRFENKAHLWKDYSKVDAVLAIRSFNKNKYDYKPATKLYNAWVAGVPAILGSEFAYQAERKTKLDYIEVKSVKGVIKAIKKLKENKKFRKAIVKNGFERAKEISPDKITEKWRKFFLNTAVPTYHKNIKKFD